MDPDTLDVRVARLEERTASLEHWRDVLATDIEQTNKLLAQMNEKLDTAIRKAQSSVPNWAHWLIYILVAAVSILGAHAAGV